MGHRFPSPLKYFLPDLSLSIHWGIKYQLTNIISGQFKSFPNFKQEQILKITPDVTVKTPSLTDNKII